MKLLLVSDAGLNVNKGGFPQTLYNLFSFLPPENLLFITSLQANTISPPSQPFENRVITYNLATIPVQQNRLGNFLNNFITRFNYSIQQFNSFKKIRKAIKAFNADIVVVAPNGPDAVFAWNRLKDAFGTAKVFPYFMDDWLYQSNLKWAGNNIHALTKTLLATHTNWLMISESLAGILAERYNLTPTKVLAVHNPVNLQNFKPVQPVRKKFDYTIAYAGALWQMHFDAFMVIAKAIKILRDDIAVRLIVYTGESNWEWRKQELATVDVEYGGYISYVQIHSTLQKADCCLLTSSFTDEWQTHSKGSVQTKITDYLKAGRLIISCGPAYSANHHFLKKHGCGICIETNDAKEAAVELKNILNDIEKNQAFVERGYTILHDEFSFEIVHKRLKEFLAA